MRRRAVLRVDLVVPVVLALVSLVACEGDPVSTGDVAVGTIGAAAGAEDLSAIGEFDVDAAAALGRGFLVWESNRTGAWRIWTRALGGSGLRQLSPEEPGRQHCCAHISPDGRRVVYLSLSGRGQKYPGGKDTGTLRLIGADGRGDRELVSAARTYHESRAAVWRSDSELIHLTGGGRTALLDVDSGESEILVSQPAEEFGWLVNSTLSHATLGLPSFSPFDKVRRRVAPHQTVAGCQAYFSQDGRWGYWAAGAGGPIHRIDLASRQVTTMLRKNDPRLPDDRGYLYFPMTSDDGRFLAVGASRGRHDHFKADYEIFLFETDPRTLEVQGPAVRFTFDPAVDRFPDVWAEPLALGDHAGEVPFEVRLEAGEGDWKWDLGDGTVASGASITHRYDSAGVFRVSATFGREVRAGRVRVAPAAAPRPVRSELRDGGRRVVVWFDEDVAAAGLEARLESGRTVTGAVVSEDGRSVAVELDRALDRTDRLVLTGLADRAQRPNAAPSLVIDLDPPLWPSNESDMALLWQTAAAANLVRDRAAGVDRAPTLKSNGRATLDHAFAMDLSGGTFTADGESSRLVISELQRANEMSLELTLISSGSSDGQIVSLGGSGRKALVLSQRGNTLVFRTRSRRNRTKQWSPAVELFEITSGRAVHVVVTYRPGLLSAYRDGELVLESSEIQGDFFQWERGDLILGGDWQGTIEGLAVYGRVLEAAEVEENAARYRALRAERSEVPRVVIEATRLRSVTPARLADISPYREALVTADYRVEAVIEGRLEATEIQVAEWVIMGGIELPTPPERATLTLERFADNPQLEGVVLGSALGRDDSPDLYYAVPRTSRPH